MNELNRVRSFLESMSYEEERCRCLNQTKGRNPFVTISRESGAGGNSLAQAILSEMKTKHQDDPLLQGWQAFDQELCEKIADEPGLSVSLQSLIESEYRSIIEDMMRELISRETPQDVVNKRIFHLILTLATVGKAIIVGRGGACFTRKLPLGIHIRLVAPLPVRIKRMEGLLHLTEKKARQLVSEQDKGRARLVKTYFNRDIEDPLLYDAIWNTDTVPMDQIAASIVMMIQEKACLCRHESRLAETRKVFKHFSHA